MRRRFLRADRRDGSGRDDTPAAYRRRARGLGKADRGMPRAVKRFVQTVLLLLLSPFAFLALGLTLAVVRLGDFLTGDD